MRTNERSYLQAIGGQDSDRLKSLHDDICLYLATSEKVEKLLGLALKRDTPPRLRPITRRDLDESERTHIMVHPPSPEVGAALALLKPRFGSPRVSKTTRLVRDTAEMAWSRKKARISTVITDKYSRPMASFDLLVSGSASIPALYEDEYFASSAEYKPELHDAIGKVEYEHDRDLGAFRILVEVKTKISSIGDVIQQLDFYSRLKPDFYDDNFSLIVLACAEPFGAHEKNTLERHGYLPIYVSPAHVAEFRARSTAVIEEPF